MMNVMWNETKYLRCPLSWPFVLLFRLAHGHPHAHTPLQKLPYLKPRDRFRYFMEDWKRNRHTQKVHNHTDKKLLHTTGNLREMILPLTHTATGWQATDLHTQASSNKLPFKIMRGSLSSRVQSAESTRLLPLRTRCSTQQTGTLRPHRTYKTHSLIQTNGI